MNSLYKSLQINIEKMISLPKFEIPLPDRWLNEFESMILFNSVILTDAECSLEIGSWIGRSSCVIATAVAQCARTDKHFEIIDYGITGSEEWIQRFGSSPFFAHDADRFCKAIYANGGTVAVLKQNLCDRKLNNYVNLITLGDILDYRTTRKYKFIFCDCTHDMVEIERNIPAIAEMLDDDAILICDDIAELNALNFIKDMTAMDTVYLSNMTDPCSKFGILSRGKYANCFS